ncbi:MAG: hypothetical protein M5U34_45140 [Chloroflexi bacterium]|nr:hypothetical protein [Chloroflexota bacterium]
MAESYEELRKLTKEQLIQKYDSLAKSTQIGLNFLRDEIARRDAEEQTAQMIQVNNQMRNMTIIITVFTIINVIAVIISLLN